MSDSCRATLAIRLESRPDSRALLRRTSDGSVSESASDTLQVTSQILDAATACTRLRRPRVRSALQRDIGVISTRSSFGDKHVYPFVRRVIRSGAVSSALDIAVASSIGWDDGDPGLGSPVA